MKNSPPDRGRRRLLASARNAGAAGVAAAVLGPAATAGTAAPAAADAAPEPQEPPRYRETDHIRKYYRHARF